MVIQFVIGHRLYDKKTFFLIEEKQRLMLIFNQLSYAVKRKQCDLKGTSTFIDTRTQEFAKYNDMASAGAPSKKCCFAKISSCSLCFLL